MARTLCVCADDFGATAAVDDAILALAGAGRVNAVSCLVQGARWTQDAVRLQALPSGVDVGLHFDLTEGIPASAELRRVWPRLPSLPQLLALALARALPRAAIAAEWQAQWEAFVQSLGRAPAFLDGHQHVHHLPVVRDAVLAAAQAHGCAVRNTGHLRGPGFRVKRRVIESTGGRALERRLQRLGIAHNRILVGAYDFRAADYRTLVRAWIAGPEPQLLLFCHPGRAPGRDGHGAAADPIAEARVREAAYLGSAAFGEDLREAGLSLGRVWERRSSAGSPRR